MHWATSGGPGISRGSDLKPKTQTWSSVDAESLLATVKHRDLTPGSTIEGILLTKFTNKAPRITQS